MPTTTKKHRTKKSPKSAAGVEPKPPRPDEQALTPKLGRDRFEPIRAIRVRGAREHNLKGVDIDIPRDRLVVITGLSGSGKSSLAFDTIFAEGQRKYMESLSAYARQFLDQLKKPDVEDIEGLPPTIAIEHDSDPQDGPDGSLNRAAFGSPDGAGDTNAALGMDGTGAGAALSNLQIQEDLGFSDFFAF